MIEKVSLSEALGKKLAHDITEIRPGEFKGVAFRKGTEICDGDICHLQRLGKNHLYVLEVEEDELHEDEAALMLAQALAGDGIRYDPEAREGKIRFFADRDGLLTVNAQALLGFNMVDEVMCATLHNFTIVKEGEIVGATRAIPLVAKCSVIDHAVAVAQVNGGVLAVRPLNPTKAGLVITGNEIYSGLVKDRFEPVLRKKLQDFSSDVIAVDCVPDDSQQIGKMIHSHLNSGCDLILLTGGMSVDPDDVTREGIRIAGAAEIYYGAAALPGAMFLVAYAGRTPIIGVPACGIHHKTTVLDLILPRVLAGVHINKKDLATLGHGGLCKECFECIYPLCPFGKGG